MKDRQKYFLTLIEKGYGIDASPRELTRADREALDDLVSQGVIRKSKNHSKDKYGCYCKVEAAARKEGQQ